MADTARLVLASALFLGASTMIFAVVVLDFDRAPSVGALRPRVLLPAAAVCLVVGSVLVR